jgi:hypothetical protein
VDGAEGVTREQLNLQTTGECGCGSLIVPLFVRAFYYYRMKAKTCAKWL